MTGVDFNADIKDEAKAIIAEKGLNPMTGLGSKEWKDTYKK